MFHTAVKIHSKYERMRVNHEFYSIGGGGGGVVLPYISYMEMCHPPGYGFLTVHS